MPAPPALRHAALRRAPALVAACALAACGSVDARGDFASAAEGVREHTQSDQVFEPDMSEAEIEQRIEEFLRGGVSVDEAVSVALVNRSEIRGLYWELGLSRAQVVQAGLLRNPIVSVSTRFPDGAGITNITVAASQSLLDLILRSARQRAARAHLEETRLRLIRTATELAAGVRATCYRTLALRRSEALLGEQEDLAAKTLELAQHRYQAGLADRVDVDLARVGLSRVRQERSRARAELQRSDLEVAHRMGLSRAGREWELSGELPESVRLPEVEQLVGLALEQRLEVQEAVLRRQAAEADLKREDASLFSELSIGVEGERAESPPNLLGPAVSLDLPIWDQNRAGVARALFELRRVQEEIAGWIERVAWEVRAAASDLAAAADRVRRYEEETLPQARSAVAAADKAYQAGQRDLIDLLDAQQVLLAEREGYARSLGEYAAALAELERALGARLTRSAESEAPR